MFPVSFGCTYPQGKTKLPSGEAAFVFAAFPEGSATCFLQLFASLV